MSLGTVLSDTPHNVSLGTVLSDTPHKPNKQEVGVAKTLASCFPSHRYKSHFLLKAINHLSSCLNTYPTRHNRICSRRQTSCDTRNTASTAITTLAVDIIRPTTPTTQHQQPQTALAVAAERAATCLFLAKIELLTISGSWSEPAGKNFSNILIFCLLWETQKWWSVSFE